MPEWFRSPTIFSPAARVDREKRIIYGVSLATKGPAIGHNLDFDDQSIDDVVEHSATAPTGLKSRFTHPGESSDGLGSYLGRYHNARREGDQAKADLHFGRMASRSPDGDLADYVMGLAEEDPESFGLSIVANIQREYRVDSEGNPLLDAEGKQLDPVARIQRLHAADVVDEPAANIGLFDTRHPGSPVTAVTRVLDRAFFSSDPQTLREKAAAFLDHYFAEKGLTPMSQAPVIHPPAAPPVSPPPAAPAYHPLAAPLQLEPATANLSEAAVAKLIGDQAKELFRVEAERRKQIRGECAKFKMSESFIDALLDENLSVGDSRAKILDQLAKDQESVGFIPGDSLRSGAASKDKFQAAMGTALELRALSGLPEATILKHSPVALRGQGWEDLRYLSLMDMAKESLSHEGCSLRGLAPEQIAKASLGFGKSCGVTMLSGGPAYHVTGSFPYLLMNSINKSLVGAYELSPVTWPLVFNQGESVGDFKNIDRVALSEAPNLKMWAENTKMSQVAFTDEKETYGVESYAAKVSISWRAVVNDDLSGFTRIPRMLGDACAQTVNAMAWSAMLSSNPMFDGQPFFSAVAGNRKQSNIMTAAALSVVSVGAAAARMMLVRGRNNKDGTISERILRLKPEVCVVPAELSLTASQLFYSQTDPSNSNSNVINPYAAGERKILPITEPLLSDSSPTAWYLFASKLRADIITIVFLRGQEQPVVRTNENWDDWSLDWQAVQTMVAGRDDWRGAIKNPGV